MQIMHRRHKWNRLEMSVRAMKVALQARTNRRKQRTDEASIIYIIAMQNLVLVTTTDIHPGHADCQRKEHKNK